MPAPRVQYNTADTLRRSAGSFVLLLTGAGAHVGNRSLDAACRMAAERGLSRVRLPEIPAVSLPQRQPPIPDPTSAPNIYPLLLLPSCPLEHSALSWSRGGAAGGGSLLHEAGHGSVYVCGAPRSALSLLGRWKSRCTCNKSSAGPPPGLTLHHSQAGSRSRIRASSCCVQAAAQRALT